MGNLTEKSVERLLEGSDERALKALDDLSLAQVAKLELISHQLYSAECLRRLTRSSSRG